MKGTDVVSDEVATGIGGGRAVQYLDEDLLVELLQTRIGRVSVKMRAFFIPRGE